MPPHSVFTADRLVSHPVQLNIQPGFRIDPSDRIFVIGSCFAREIHKALSTRRFEVGGESLGNKYSAFGILQTIRWALEGGFHERHILPMTDGGWVDPHRHPQKTYATAQEAVLSHTTALDQAAAELREADVVVITLGLVEAWFDEALGVWLNDTPPIRRLSIPPSRFRPMRTTHAQNRDAFLKILDLLGQLRSDLRIVISVSPVPLYATFFGEDVLVANAYSKATLRSVVSEAIAEIKARNHSAIDYFPSYEMVTLSHPGHVWRPAHPDGVPDGRHVRSDFVSDVIIHSFVEHYVAKQAGSSNAMGNAVTRPLTPGAR